MKLRLCLPAAAVAVLCSVGSEAAELAPPPSPKNEPFDVLYYSEARPVVMRLWVTSDGTPLNHAWERFADALFAKLDADSSGALEEKEAAKLRQTLVLLTGRGVRSDEAGRAPMTRDGLAAYLRLNDLGPLRLPPIVNNRQNNRGFRRGGAPTPEMLDKALMDYLDTNKDGKLSAAELAASATVLARIDADENELIGMDELLGRPVNSPFFVEEFDNRMGGAAPPGADLQFLGRKPDSALARRLLGRYGPKPTAANPTNPNGAVPAAEFSRRGGQPAPVESAARRLTAKDVKLSAEAFAALDQDGDGELDAEELARFGQSAVPEVGIALRLGRLPAGRARAEAVSAGGPLKTVAGEFDADVALEVPGARLELIPAKGSADAARAVWRSNHLDRFRTFDRDNNGYLDANESNSDFVLRELFAYFDADKDGKVFEKELTAALDGANDLATGAARGLTAVDVSESGRGLFGLIDTDGDARLSVRELRVASKLVARLDADRDGLLAPGEVPRRFLANLSHGLASAAFARPVPFNPGGMQGTPRPPVGPVWFQKMDRNRDGDVSRREFLGTDEEFRKLDADGDGLLSPQEAEAAGRD